MNYGSQVGSHNFVFVIVIVFVKKPSSLRYLRAKGRANKKTRFSEAIFRDNTLFTNPLTPIFLVEIFFVLKIGGLRLLYFVRLSAEKHLSCSLIYTKDLTYYQIALVLSTIVSPCRNQRDIPYLE